MVEYIHIYCKVRRTTNPGGTRKPYNPLKGIWNMITLNPGNLLKGIQNPITQDPDNPLKGIRDLVQN